VLRLLAVFSFLLSIPLLLQAHSVGALLTTGATFLVLMLIVIFARLRSRERLLMLACVAAAIVPVVVAVAVLAFEGTLGAVISSFITESLGKDATLTGRTVLWRIALAEIHKQPLLGVGYSAFWLHGNLLAEAIWRDFSIESRMGFHFHDTYLEFAVELGWLGVAALVGTLVLAAERAVRLALADRTLATAALAAAMFCLLSRTLDEVDAPYPFAIGTFLLFVIAAYGADYARAARRGARELQAPAVRHLLPGERRHASA
jgi:exopolysaccharide production protein ExoQ